MKNKILFILPNFPRYGASGYVVLLRHIERFSAKYDIILALPDFQKNYIPEYYPKEWKIYFWKTSAWYLPPFLEHFEWLIFIRNKFICSQLQNILLENKSITSIISLLNGYHAEAAMNLKTDDKVSKILILHDKWETLGKNNDFRLREIRKKHAENAMSKADYLFPVTLEMINGYQSGFVKKTEILRPIPHGYETKASWNDSFASKSVFVHTGTIDLFSLPFFEYFLQQIPKTDKLELVYVMMDFLKTLFESHKNIKIVDFFAKNEDSLKYVAQNATAMIIYYGLEENENLFSKESFPSRFVEFSHCGVPIICVTPKNSAFYNFLKQENYSLLFNKDNIEALKNVITSLREKQSWEQYASEVKEISTKYFQPDKIHAIFENKIQR